MKQYKKILLATDFSSASDVAAQRAKELSSYYEGDITVVHIVNYVPPVYASVEIPMEYASKELLKERAEKHLAVWTKDRSLEDCDLIIESGQAKRLILDVAEDRSVDLVVLGAHGETGLSRMFGSIANAVAQRATCDVLIVRE